MFENNTILGGRHADVLDAHPDTEESKAALVEEIKNRARCVAGGLEKGGREREEDGPTATCGLELQETSAET